MLTLSFIDNPPYNYLNDWVIAQTHDAELFLENGGTVYLENVASTVIYCGSTGGGTHFDSPDSFVVHKGREEVLTFKGIGGGSGWGPAATDIHAVDELGWVGKLSPDYLWVMCSYCPWYWTEFVLPVSVPLRTPEGTRNLVRIFDVDERQLTSFELVVKR